MPPAPAIESQCPAPDRRVVFDSRPRFPIGSVELQSESRTLMAIRKVLVVDDVSTDLRHLQSIISSAGYQVVTAASGREALQKVQTDKPDLIFLDIVMEDMDGYQACRKLCTDAGTKHIPVVMVSGNAQRVDKLWAQKQGARGYVTKPYSVDDITKQIAKFR